MPSIATKHRPTTRSITRSNSKRSDLACHVASKDVNIAAQRDNKRMKVELATSKESVEKKSRARASSANKSTSKFTKGDSLELETTTIPETKDVEKKCNDEMMLLDIGPLVKGTLLKRPSAQIRSPYVADVELPPKSSRHKKSAVVLAHAPALNVGGLCVPNKYVFLSERDKQKESKTSHAIELVTSLGCTPSDHDVLVGAHPRLAELLVDKVLQLGLLQDVIGFGPAIRETKTKNTSKKKAKSETTSLEEMSAKKKEQILLKKQFIYGDSRIDFAIESSSAKKLALIEVKNVVCADYNVSYSPPVPKRKSDNRCVITSDESIETYERTGLFPFGLVGQKFEGKKVVSERAIKHVRNLVSAIVTSKSNNDVDVAVVQPIIIFVINRGDCKKMRLLHEVCPMFAEEVRIARENGVIVTSFSVRWTSDGKAYFNGIVPVDIQ